MNKADRLYGPKTALKGKPEKAISSQERPYGMKLTRTRLCVSLLCVTLTAEIKRSKVRIRVSLLGVAQKLYTSPDAGLGERIENQIEFCVLFATVEA